jgi:hypothetical protein
MLNRIRPCSFASVPNAPVLMTSFSKHNTTLSSSFLPCALDVTFQEPRSPPPPAPKAAVYLSFHNLVVLLRQQVKMTLHRITLFLLTHFIRLSITEMRCARHSSLQFAKYHPQENKFTTVVLFLHWTNNDLH